MSLEQPSNVYERLYQDLSIRTKRLMEKLDDPRYLFSLEELQEYQRQFRGRESSEWSAWLAFAGGNLRKEKIPLREILTKEYITSLADYLAKRVGDESTPVSKSGASSVVLEVGAGDGRLTHFLNQELEKKTKGKERVVATDTLYWETRTKVLERDIVLVEQAKPAFPVEKLDYQNALAKYKPDIVICSWMPPGEDWTWAFRKLDNVAEYILIGPPDDNVTGKEWETWGIDYEGTHKGEKPPYKKDGFKRVELNALDAAEFSRSKLIGDNIGMDSRTVSFRRVGSTRPSGTAS